MSFAEIRRVVEIGYGDFSRSSKYVIPEGKVYVGV